MKKLIEILESLFHDINFNNENKLVDDGIIDSYDMVTLVMEINEAFKIDIGVLDITAGNFNSVQSMWRLIESLV